MKIQMKMKYMPTVVYWGSAAYCFLFSTFSPDMAEHSWVANLFGSLVVGAVFWLDFKLFFVLPLVVFFGMYNSRLRRIHRHH